MVKLKEEEFSKMYGSDMFTSIMSSSGYNFSSMYLEEKSCVPNLLLDFLSFSVFFFSFPLNLHTFVCSSSQSCGLSWGKDLSTYQN